MYHVKQKNIKLYTNKIGGEDKKIQQPPMLQNGSYKSITENGRYRNRLLRP